MAVVSHPDSLLGRLATIPDPRQRKGRRYPLPAILGLVLIGMLHGRDSLRGAWVWAGRQWGQLWRPLGAHSPQFPADTTVRDVLARLDADAVDRHLRPWLEPFLDRPRGGRSADGKVLRGSKRDNAPALRLVALAAHARGTVLARRAVVGGDEVAAVLILLTEIPLAGRTVTMDAGILHAEATQTITQQQGDDAGVVKGNQAEMQALLDDWIAEAVLSPPGRGCSPVASAGSGDRAAAPVADSDEVHRT